MNVYSGRFRRVLKGNNFFILFLLLPCLIFFLSAYRVKLMKTISKGRTNRSLSSKTTVLYARSYRFFQTENIAANPSLVIIIVHIINGLANSQMFFKRTIVYGRLIVCRFRVTGSDLHTHTNVPVNQRLPYTIDNRSPLPGSSAIWTVNVRGTSVGCPPGRHVAFDDDQVFGYRRV